MTSRVLPPIEWPRLAGTDLGPVLESLTPETAEIVVVERDGAIVACWAVLTVTHLEGLWIDPACRGTASAARRLLNRTVETLLRRNVARVLTAASSDRVRALLTHIGATKIPAEMFSVQLEQLCQPR